MSAGSTSTHTEAASERALSRLVAAVQKVRWPRAAAATCLSAGTSVAVFGYMRGDSGLRILTGIAFIALAAIAAILVRLVDRCCDRISPAPSGQDRNDPAD